MTEVEIQPPKKAHGLVTFMRLGQADSSVRAELLHRSPCSKPRSRGHPHLRTASLDQVRGGESIASDAAVLGEAELIFYGGAGKYAAARKRLERWVERDAAARQLQKRVMLSMNRPSGKRGKISRESAAVVIQRRWRVIREARLGAMPQKRPSKTKKKGPVVHGSVVRKEKEAYEVVIKRLRMSMYVRKIQMLFKSPEYQRQAYLRRKAVMKMQALMRKRNSAYIAEQRARAKHEIGEGIMRRHGGLAQMDALDVIVHQYKAYKSVSDFKTTAYNLVGGAIDSSWRAQRDAKVAAAGWTAARQLQRGRIEPDEHSA